MGDRLYADLDAIEEFASQLGTVRSDFDAGVNSTSGFRASMAAPVQTAIDDFNRSWAQGRTSLDSYFAALIGMCQASATQLRATDAALAAQLHDHPHHLRGPNADF